MASAIDESTLRTVDNGRAALGEILSSAQSELRKVFLIFLTGFLLTFYVFKYYGVPFLKQQALPGVASVNAITAFDVILLQTKVALIGGAIVGVLGLLYVSRDTLRERGLLPEAPLSRWQIAVLVAFASLLFTGGLLYSFYVFFPMLFEFLASNTIKAGLKPHYSIVNWVRFLALLAIGMGLAAELPLIMMTLSYARIVPYETFRDKWRHAVVIIFVLGALFSPPDPFTQIMWSIPLLFLYVLSLLLTRFILTIKYSSDEVGLIQIAYQNGHIILGCMLLTGASAYKAVTLGYGARANAYLQQLQYDIPPLPSVEWLFAMQKPAATIAFGATVALIVGFVVFIVQLFRTVDPTDTSYGSASAPASTGDPSALDLSRLDADSIAVAPDEAFAAMTEDEALEHAGAAMEADNPEKAQAILDRFDAAQEVAGAGSAQAGMGGGAAAPNDTSGGASGSAPPSDEEEDSDVGDVVTQTTTGMLNSFTEDERSEDDIGGYFYDIQFILGSLTSKMFRIIGVFVLVMGGVFTALYKGGLGALKKDFLTRLPAGVSPNEVDVVPLHPVEGLVFQVKLAAVIGIAVTLPMILYYAWPALNERGIGISTTSSGSRGILFAWTMTSLITLLAGSIIGYAVVAPTVISWLAYDAIQAGMLLKYQIKAAGWLVFFTTIGIGLLATIPTTLLFLHRGGFVPFRLLSKHWREVVVGIIGVIAVAAPGGVFGMLLFSLPVVGAYILGLVLLWVYTLGGRRKGPLTKSRGA